MRTTAIEARWNQEAERAERADLLEQAQAELAQVRTLYAASQKELKTIRAQAERLGSENRVLRRAQRGGKRDEVILQLETELYQEHHERADMEENLSRAFRSVLDDAHSRITLLTAERDRLMVALEEVTGKKGGFALRK
jgi:DNA repair exonuclease SbcCD ATPase subunit